MRQEAICVGDCNADDPVTVDELVTAVGIAFDADGIVQCPNVDATGDGAVTIDELTRAVGNALHGCSR